MNHVQAVPIGDAGAYKIYLKATNQPEGTIVPFGANVFDEIVVLALAIEKPRATRPPTSPRSSPRSPTGGARACPIRLKP